MSESISEKKSRDSNVELLRIVMMIIIIAHHYIVNSGITEEINSNILRASCSAKDYFALVFGWGGKYAINVFLLITGYFSCTQNFSLRKIIAFCLETMFYTIVIYFIFLLSGYERFDLIDFGKMSLTIPCGFGKGFTSSYIALYFCIPFINKVVLSLTKDEFSRLLIVLLIIFTVVSTFFLNSSFEYLGWYITVYLVGAYLRLYPVEITFKKYIGGGGSLLAVKLDQCSCYFICFRFHFKTPSIFLVCSRF